MDAWPLCVVMTSWKQPLPRHHVQQVLEQQGVLADALHGFDEEHGQVLRRGRRAGVAATTAAHSSTQQQHLYLNHTTSNSTTHHLACLWFEGADMKEGTEAAVAFHFPAQDVDSAPVVLAVRGVDAEKRHDKEEGGGKHATQAGR